MKTFNILRNNCTELQYTILSKNKALCELFISSKYNNQITIFYVALLKCPVGFSLNMSSEMCDCDPVLNTVISQCSINNQTVLYRTNCWITAESHNNKHYYNVSYHSITVYLTHRYFTSQLLIHNVSLTGLVYCVELVKKISILYLARLTVNIVLTFISFSSCPLLL